MGVESEGMLLAANDPRDGSNPPVLVTVVDPDTPDGFEVR
jgi:tRNA-binding EMAP/Myf-like protein